MTVELNAYTFHVLTGYVLTAGSGVIVIVLKASSVLQLLFPVTVYVVVTVGLAVT